MVVVRPAAVAGQFYPGRAEELRRAVDGLLAEAATLPLPGPAPPRALLLPHAGYVYSGLVAARGYAAMRPYAENIRRVVLLGPTHRVAVEGVAESQADAFETPLGSLPVESLDAAVRSRHPELVDGWAAHAPEHSLEVHLPFLQRLLGEVTIVPLAVGRCPPEAVAEILQEVWGGPETLVVVSTDLSHYLPHEEATVADEETVRRLVRLDGPLTHRQACGASPVNGFLEVAQQHGLRATLVARCTSGDTAGDRRRVVGYAALAFA